MGLSENRSVVAAIITPVYSATQPMRPVPVRVTGGVVYQRTRYPLRECSVADGSGNSGHGVEGDALQRQQPDRSLWLRGRNDRFRIMPVISWGNCMLQQPAPESKAFRDHHP